MEEQGGAQEFYIGGKWVAPLADETLAVINPATEETDRVDRHGRSPTTSTPRSPRPSAAFETFSRRPRGAARAARSDHRGLQARADDLAEIISQEMGAPLWLAQRAQATAGLGHFMTARKVLADFEFEKRSWARRSSCASRSASARLITPWNWPINQIACKVAPALAAGCTMVLKPSEVAPLNAIIFAEILDEAGVPAGVFNLVNGDGVGRRQRRSSAHPDVDMVSFTGSTRAGIEVARNAAPTVKRVAQELGGKSANIVLDDADFEAVDRARRRGDVHQLRPVVQRADPHARARRRAWTRPPRSPRAAAERDRRRRSATPSRAAIGPVVSERPVQPDPAA